MIRPRLIIFAKAPVIGRAKTRLAADIGKVHAKRIYRSMTRRILMRVQDPRWDTVLAVTPVQALGQISDWDGVDQITQTTGSLSPRLAQVYSDHKGPLVVIGTDAPQVSRQDIVTAFKSLRSCRAVFGPADDGGFWLIGLNAPVSPAVFDNVRWSSATTLTDLSANISGQVTQLRELVDIDDLNGLRRVRREYPHLI